VIKDNAVAPKLSSVTLARFCDAEGFERPRRLPVIPASGALIDCCYPNVVRQITLHGGSMIQGYKVIEFPKLMLQAIHHAVWLDRKGRMVDVTPDQRGWRTIVFACDNAVSAVGITTNPSILPRFINISGLNEIDEAIEISLRLNQMRLAGALPNGMLPELNQTDPEVVRLMSDARTLLSIAQSKVGAP
jgi:hypothetical protein